MRKIYVLALIASLLIMVAPAVAQTQAEGAQATSNTNNQTADTQGADNVTIKAGAVVGVDVDQSSLTDKWAGFYGNISGNKILGSTSGTMYEWTASNLADAKVLVTPKGEPVPSSVSAVSSPGSFLDSYYSADEFTTGAAAASNTFTDGETLSIGGITTSSTVTVDTYGSGTSENSALTTFLVENDASSGSPVYVAEGNDEATGFEGQALNYQMLVGVGETASEETFSFYLALP